MKSIAALLTVVALGFCGLVTRAEAQDTKWVKGKVTAVADDSVTVSVRGKAMKFTVDKDSKLTASGAGTEMRKEGGVVITKFVKVGDGVEVKYHDMGATLHAADIRHISDAGEGSSSDDKPPMKEASPKTSTASGTVTAVSGTSLTVKGDSAEWTFAVDGKTTVVGQGVGTKGREAKEAGKGTTIVDLVGKNDMVTVTFHDMGATKHAAEVRITRKGLTK